MYNKDPKKEVDEKYEKINMQERANFASYLSKTFLLMSNFITIFCIIMIYLLEDYKVFKPHDLVIFLILLIVHIILMIIRFTCNINIIQIGISVFSGMSSLVNITFLLSAIIDKSL